MRIGALIVVLACVVGCSACAHTNAGTRALVTKDAAHATGVAPNPVAAKVDFQTQIRPIMEARCQPCHFSGGKVYAKMPFDRAETIKVLGTKLFTRIKDDNERRLISAFLTQQ